MIKKTLYFLIFFVLIGCNNGVQKTETISKKDSNILLENHKLRLVNKLEYTENEVISKRDSLLVNEFKTFKIYQISDTISTDFNGDKIIDYAYLSNNKIFVIDGLTMKRLQVGLDQSFGDMKSDFSWVNFWGTTKDRETYEIIIKDSEIVGDKITKLENNSIFVRKDEVGGGVITFKEGKFIWVHQSD